MVGCYKLLGVEFFVLASILIDQVYGVPVNLTQDKHYSLFCNFLFLVNEKVLYLKGQSLENGLFCIFQTIGNILKAKTIEYKVKQTDL